MQSFYVIVYFFVSALLYHLIERTRLFGPPKRSFELNYWQWSIVGIYPRLFSQTMGPSKWSYQTTGNYRISTLDCSSILSELRSTNSPCLARGGAGRWRRRQRPQKCVISLIPHHNRRSKPYWLGMVAVIYAKQHNKKSGKIHATCGDDVTFLVVLVFEQMRYTSF